MQSARYSQLPTFTQKEVPKDAAIASHQLMIRAGFIRKSASGLYSYLPFGYEVYRKIENIIREIMNEFGGIEVHLPLLTNREYWDASGRWQRMGKEMMRMTDRHNVEYALSPTHEEAMVSLASGFLKSYRQLPVNLYQIGEKFRDEIRPRYGLIRCREFVMKDAYSFHENNESLDKTYSDMRTAYRKIFDSIGIETIPVQADSGSMGGSGSEEFMVASEIGEETLLICKDKNCGYSSNQEKTEYLSPDNPQTSNPDMTAPEKVHTPDLKTIEAVADFLKKDKKDFIKSVILENVETVVVAFIPGDRELNEIKISNHTGANELLPAQPETIRIITGAEPGYAGPHGLPVKNGQKIRIANADGRETEKTVLIAYDRSLQGRSGLVGGGNDTGYHYTHLSQERDFVMENIYDLVLAKEGDICPSCGKSHLWETKGIEVGHIFKLGDKYTRSMEVTVLNENGKPIYPVMGCYGIGLGRTMATFIEQNHDEKGMIWTPRLSPFYFYYVAIYKDVEEKATMDAFYEEVRVTGKSVYYDDRKETPGVKFNDADLVGFPYQIILGKNYLSSGTIELKERATMRKITIEKSDFLAAAREDNIPSLFPE